ncbi:MAG: hypothetical protein JSU94_06260 [Phycisphaerales bacterium]|nr:MAG: hypothetical protein JSU94_06260 [Phycisphaerales bacterium]
MYGLRISKTWRRVCVVGVLSVMALMTGPDCAAADSDPNLLVWLKFDETAGTIAADSAGDHHGTLVNAPTWAPGIVSGGLAFAETGGLVLVEVNEPETEVTHMLWFKTADPLAGIFSILNSASGDHDRSIYLNDGNLCARLFDNETIATDGLDLADDQWHHAAHVFGAGVGGQKLYVDGVERASGLKTASDFNWQTEALVGYCQDALARHFTGTIDDVRIYTKALGETEIQEAMLDGIESSSLGTFNIGDIPPSSVQHGDEYAFLVKWEGHAWATYSMTLDPPPAGAISLSPVASGHLGLALFDYVPDPCDKFPFTVCLTADDGAEIVSQSFEIIPMPNLAPEQEVFDPSKHTGAETLEIDDVEVSWEQSLSVVSMNYGDYKPYSYRIMGSTVVIEDGHENGLYDDLNGRFDINSVEIKAEVVIVRSSLQLPQTDVFIDARMLSFEGPDANIITTPKELLHRPGVSVDANDGLDAGDISLNIGSFAASEPGVRLDVTGGAGQPGGYGVHGIDGRDLAWRFHTLPVPCKGVVYIPFPTGYECTYWVAYTRPLLCVGWTLDQTCGTKEWPTDGTSPEPCGKPGDGGRGGVVTSTVDAAAYVRISGGSPGAPPTPTSPPYNEYRGSSDGKPLKAMHVKTKCHSCGSGKVDVDVFAIHEGRTYPAQPIKYGASGPAGAYVTAGPAGGHPFAWLTPVVMNKFLSQAANDYLNYKIEPARTRLADLRYDMEAYMADPAWAAVDANEQLELHKVYNETQRLLYQIENNLDYFGYPAGWVPMLSFEVTTGMFDDEIDRAIDMLYLAYWIQDIDTSAAQKENSLEKLQAKLQEEIDKTIEAYDEANTRLPGLKNRAAQLHMEIDYVAADLETLENDLEDQARHALREPWWRTGLKLAAKTSQMIPLLEPAVGGVLNFAAEFDPDDPWGTILAGAQLGDTLVNEEIDSAATLIGLAGAAAKGDAGAGAKAIAGQVTQLKFDLTGGLEQMEQILRNREAPADEIQAELERLAANSTEFQGVLKELEALNLRKGEFARELSDTMLEVSGLSDRLVEALLEMDTLREDLASSAMLDPQAVMYLQNVERRATERLLKYHYYMAKAYEYRMVTPYEGTMNLDDLVAEIKGFEPNATGEVILPDQFATIKGVYTDAVATVAQSIYDHYIRHTPEKSAAVRFSLTPEELAALNDGRTVRLNLIDLPEVELPADREGLRIYDFSIVDIETLPVGGPYEPSAQLDVTIEHSGLSKLVRDGQTYQFVHRPGKTLDPIEWTFQHFPYDADTIPIRPSKAHQSLLESLLDDAAASDMLLYSRPGAWADLVLSMRIYNNAGKDIDLSKLRLQLAYDYTARTEDLAEIHLMVSQASLGDFNEPAASQADFQPYFVCDTTDRNGRQDARGQARRVYVRSTLEPVSFTAQKRYGGWKFNKWTDRHGDDLPGGPHTDRTITVLPDTDRTIVAQYVPVETLWGDINCDCVVDGEDLMKLAASWLRLHGSININSDKTGDMIDLADFADLGLSWGKSCDEQLNGTLQATGSAVMSPYRLKASPRRTGPHDVEWIE